MARPDIASTRPPTGDTRRRTRRRMTLGLLACLSAGVGLQACAGGSGLRLDPPGPGVRTQVWPAPPAPSRIQFVRSFTRPQDLGYRRSFLRRVAGAVFGSGSDNRIQHPYGIAVSPDQKLYVVDSGARGVHMYDLLGGGYRFITHDGFLNPLCAAVDEAGRVYVSDSEAGAVLVFEADGDLVTRITEGLRRPTGLAFDRNRGILYVVDTEAHAIRTYDAELRPLGEMGERGTDIGRFNYPTNVAVDRTGRLYVSDTMNFRIQVFEPDGRYVTGFGQVGTGMGSFARPKGVGVDADGNIYVVEGLYDVVNIFDRFGRLLLTFGSPGEREGNFWLASGLVVDGQNRIFVADTYNGRVQVFQYLDAEPVE